MAIVRLNTNSDATWQRAWSVANAAEKATLIATYTSLLGPKRGDIIFQVDTAIFYVVVDLNILQPISGLLSPPVNLATQVTGILADGNLSSNIPLKNANNTFTGDQTTRDLIATRDIYLGGLAVPIGNWTPLTPTLTVSTGTIGLNTNFNCSYMIIDKTFFFAFYLSVALSASPQFFSIDIPLGLTTATFTLNVAAFGTGNCIVQTVPSDTKINFYKDVTGATLFTPGNHIVGGVHTFQVS